MAYEEIANDTVLANTLLEQRLMGYQALPWKKAQEIPQIKISTLLV